MEPAPLDYKPIPTFGPNSSMAAPDATTIDTGYQSGETFPVTEGNWLFNGITNNSNVSERLVKSVVNELDYLCTQNGVTPNGSVNTQINQSVNQAANQVANQVATAAVAGEATLARNASNLTNGLIGLARIPNVLIGKDADSLDGYHAVRFPLTEIYVNAMTNIVIPSLVLSQSIIVYGNCGAALTIALPAGGFYRYSGYALRAHDSVSSMHIVFTESYAAGGKIILHTFVNDYFNFICDRVA